MLKSRDEDYNFNTRGSDLEVVQNIKYLGVQIDHNLNWKEKVQAASTKISKAIGFFKYAKPFLPRESLKNRYTGIVELHFRYCCYVWGCIGSTDID